MRNRETDNALTSYRRKRNFSSTPEPAGQRPRRGRQLRFVVQKHAARHLHYDFRLELEGTLKSWAVPKGPSLDPHDKRLAMQVEDHPLDYIDFEGVIPEGNYGAGTVIVWDRGEWEPRGDPVEGYRKGKLSFRLRGKKLSGQWHLVRGRKDSSSKQPWFLMKEEDDAARPATEFSVVDAQPDSVTGGDSGRVWPSNRATTRKAPAGGERRKPAAKTVEDLPAGTQRVRQPLTISPQLATLVDAVPQRGDWSYEVKFDGYRILARLNHDSVHLFTRNGNDWSQKLPHLLSALRALDIEAWLDGEIVMAGERGYPSFQALQNAFENARTEAIQFYVFDLLYIDGHDLRGAALRDRRALLQTVLGSKPPAGIFYSDNFEAPAHELLRRACAMRLEGLIGKRADLPYRSGRSPDWIKLKCLQRQEFVIGGYTDPAGSRAGTFGALLLGVHDPETGKLRYAGRVGTGFSATTLRELIQKMEPLQTDTMPFAELTGARPARRIHWIEPKLVGEVAFSEWTEDGHARHPSFQGLRSDKSASAITAEKPLPAHQVAPTPPGNSRRKNGNEKNENLNKGVNIAITHPSRIIDTRTRTTKLDLVNYYESIAPLLLPQLADRAVSLLRAPNGIDGQHFFQKHLDTANIPQLRQLDPALFPGHPPLIAIDSLPALISCVQMNVVEFHTWNATTHDMTRPDRIVFDLDPGEGVTWPQVLQAAELIHAMLRELELEAFLKTSGGKGLHIVVPIAPRWDWDTVKHFSAAVVKHLAHTLPLLFVARSGPKNRVRKIFVDYLRNSLGATTVAAFSARARSGLGVSVPVGWKDLAQLRGSAQWSIHDVGEITKSSRKNPWKTYARNHQDLSEAAARLGVRLPKTAPSH